MSPNVSKFQSGFEIFGDIWRHLATSWPLVRIWRHSETPRRQIRGEEIRSYPEHPDSCDNSSASRRTIQKGLLPPLHLFQRLSVLVAVVLVVVLGMWKLGCLVVWCHGFGSFSALRRSYPTSPGALDSHASPLHESGDEVSPNASKSARAATRSRGVSKCLQTQTEIWRHLETFGDKIEISREYEFSGAICLGTSHKMIVNENLREYKPIPCIRFLKKSTFPT